MNAPMRKGNRISTRPIQRDDASAIYNIFSKSEVCEFYDLSPFTDLSQAVEQIENWLKNYDLGRQIRYAIIEADEVIGTCGLYSIYRHQNRANLGYELLPSKWNQGYMTDALELFLELCFEDWNFHRIQALVIPENNSSIRLLSKIGFNKEGLLKDYEIWPGRGYVDLQLYSIINNK